MPVPYAPTVRAVVRFPTARLVVYGLDYHLPATSALYVWPLRFIVYTGRFTIASRPRLPVDANAFVTLFSQHYRMPFCGGFSGSMRGFWFTAQPTRHTLQRTGNDRFAIPQIAGLVRHTCNACLLTSSLQQPAALTSVLRVNCHARTAHALDGILP